MKPPPLQDQRLLNGGMVWAALMWRDTPEAFELLAGPDAPIRRWHHIDGETHEMTERRAESELARAIAALLSGSAKGSK